VGYMCAFTARPSMDDDLKFKHPFSCIVSGPSVSGKTSFVIRFLQNLRHLCTEPKFAGGVEWCQVNPEDSVGLYNAYLDATKEPYGYLVLDLTQNTNDGLRFRSHILPDEVHLIVVYSCVGDEASEDELSHSAVAEDGRP